jgi:hypothetical protein
MPSYRVHRLKDHLRHPFRSAPHVSGTANVKPRDYEPGGTVESSSPYAAYFALKDSEAPLELGDLLEAEDGSLRIYKYVGFDEARWILPELKPEAPPNETPPNETSLNEGTEAKPVGVLATV